MSQIRYLQRKDLRDEAWNQCIDEAENGMLYAYTYYLDALCTNWDALVVNEYEAVMPLPWRKKWGLKYVYPPAFIQQLGIYGNNITKDLYPEVLQVIQSQFKFGEYYFNYENCISSVERVNLVLKLNQSYSSIRNNYKADLLKNLGRSKKHSLQYTKSNKYKETLDLYQLEYGRRFPSITASDYQSLNDVFQILAAKERLIVREVKDANGNTLALAACPITNKRIFLLVSVTTIEGKKKQANHFLLDQMIREFSNKPMMIDFEGSDIPGIAHFYTNFGAENQPYFFYRWNCLPWPLSLLKDKTLEAR